MRRIALFSDVHANSVALDAVFEDMEASGFGTGSERYCLGDLIGYGPDPLGVVDRVRDSGIPAIQGNYDEGVASKRGSCGCYYATDQAKADGEVSYAFATQRLRDADREWLLSLPMQIRLDEGGARVLLTHGSPRKINEYLLLDRTEEQLARLADAAVADAVCHGHIHIPYHRSFEVPGDARVRVPDLALAAEEPATPDRVARVHYVSSGSVGKPKDGDPRACWVELLLGGEEAVRTALEGESDDAAGPVGTTDVWLAVRVHRVAYDIESVASEMLAMGLPTTLADALRKA